MTLTVLELAALNEAHTTIPEISRGYNDLIGDIALGDVIDAAGRSNTATLTSGTTSVIADTNVQAGDQIFLQAQDAAGAALVGSATGVFVDPANIIAGTSFQIDHATAAGTEVFAYSIQR